MIKGIFISELGEIQQLGEIATLEYIIQAIESALPTLRQKENERILSKLTDKDIEQLIKSREVITTGVLEP